MKNLIIAVDGIDGVGKSSLLRRLEDELFADGHKVMVFSNPGGGSDASFKVRQVLFNEEVQKGNDLFGMGFCQMELWQRIKKEYDAGKTILIDRWTLSTLAYQHVLGGVSTEIIGKYFNMLSSYVEQYDLPLVDLHLTLHSDYETIYNRLINRKDKEVDKYEHLTREWFDKVNGCYLSTTNKMKYRNDRYGNAFSVHPEQRNRLGIHFIKDIKITSTSTTDSVLEDIMPLIDDIVYE